MREPARFGTELATISLICPLWGQVAEVTVISDEQGFVGVTACPLSEAGVTCLAPCEAVVRQWCRYVGQGR